MGSTPQLAPIDSSRFTQRTSWASNWWNTLFETGVDRDLLTSDHGPVVMG